jgi:hypothetical protein
VGEVLVTRTVLLGAMLCSSAVLTSVSELVNPMSWDGDERLAVLGLMPLRTRHTSPDARVVALMAWLASRIGHARAFVVLREAMTAYVNADRTSLGDVIDLAREVAPLSTEEARP